jgi:hypothetical protein
LAPVLRVGGGWPKWQEAGVWEELQRVLLDRLWTADRLDTAAVIDQYLTLFNSLAHDSAALEEILALFAPDVTVRLFEGEEPLVGIPALRELYGGFARGMVDSKHVGPHGPRRRQDRTPLAPRVPQGRRPPDGLERHRVRDRQRRLLITSLRNRMVAPDSRL